MIISPEYVCRVVPITAVRAGPAIGAVGGGAAIVADMTAIVTAIVRYLFATSAALGAVLCPVDGAAASDIIITNIFISLKFYTHDFSAPLV